ncbi:MAG: hypothetical protein V9G19_00485 [Tetrasphaera sp.]
MDHQFGGGKLNAVCEFEGSLDLREVRTQERQRFSVSDAARRHFQQSARRAAEDVAVAEVSVLADDDPVFGVGQVADGAVRGAIAIGKIKGVDRVVASLSWGRGRREQATGRR